MITVDYRDRRPIYEQLIDRFEDLIAAGALQPDEQLPSVRQLALELSINPNTIQRAYAELEKNGVIYSVKGRGSFVSPDFNHLQEFKSKSLLQEITTIARKAATLGLPCQTFVLAFENAYRNTGGNRQND